MHRPNNIIAQNIHWLYFDLRFDFIGNNANKHVTLLQAVIKMRVANLTVIYIGVVV